MKLLLNAYDGRIINRQVVTMEGSIYDNVN